MANPVRGMRIPDEKWNRWVAIAARSIPTDGTSATTMFVCRSVDFMCDLIERGGEITNGLVVPTTRERIVIASSIDSGKVAPTGWKPDAHTIYTTPDFEPPSWLDEYRPTGSAPPQGVNTPADLG